jgi:Concanavalin A-like lectin/glucanases superfamily
MEKKFVLASFSIFYLPRPKIATTDSAFPVSRPSVQVGYLNVTGDQLTVEAEINRTQPCASETLEEGDVVSKHDHPGDVNYLLRPNHAYINTANGFYGTPDICEVKLNKTYHIAMVYDGTFLKFYRNGFLMSQIAATGDLIQNGWPTRIGYHINQAYNSNFPGYINEVRIWNVARTQTQLQTYMNTPLPSHTTQPGLLAYYSFNDLLNKQGNPAWNGTLNGSAAINQTNSACSPFVADSCCTAIRGAFAPGVRAC